MGFSDKGSVKSSVYFGIAARSLGVRMRILKVEVCSLGFRVQDEPVGAYAWVQPGFSTYPQA